MEAPRRILFVCTGNICRSVLAEQWARRWAAQKGLPLEFRSAGVAAERFYRVPEEIRALLAAAGAPAFEHVPNLATRDALRWADSVLVMTRAQKERLLDLYPEFGRKIFLLRERAEAGSGDVEDPMGGDRAVYEACWKDLRGLVELALARETR